MGRTDTEITKLPVIEAMVSALWCFKIWFAWQYEAPMHAAFVDFSKAFDLVNHRVLWAVLKVRGLDPKLVDLIQDFYADSKASVGAQGIKSIPFPLLSGVRQGCPLSSILFNVFMDFMMRQVNHECATRGVADFRVAYRLGGSFIRAPDNGGALCPFIHVCG